MTYSLSLSREIIEEDLGEPLSDEHWARIVEEVEGRIDNLVDEIIDTIVEETREVRK